MFVQFMAHSKPLQFESFLKGLQEGKTFEEQFTGDFKSNVDKMLQAFIGKLQRI